MEKGTEPKRIGKPRYHCRDCRKTFNPLTGTLLSGLHFPERRPDQAQALIAGGTLAKAAERSGVGYTTAFRWRHRFLAALNQAKPARLPELSRRMRRISSNPSRAGDQARPVGGTDPDPRRA